MARARRSVVINGLLALALLASAGVAAYLLLRSPAEAQTPTSTARVERGRVEATVSTSGTVESRRTLETSFAVSGEVKDVLVRVGDRASKGEVLAKLEGTEGEIVRLRSPMRGTVSEVSLAAGQTVGEAGQTSTSFVGETGTASADSGDSSATGGASVVVTDLSSMVVRAYFSEVDASQLRVGQRAAVTLDALGTTVRAEIRRIDVTSTVQEGVVRYGVTLRMRRQPDGARPGQTATVSVVTQRASDALYVPSAAVQTAGGQATVTVVRGEQQARVPVTTGVEGDQTTEVLSGLSEGEQVLIPTGTGAGGFPGGGFPGLGGGLGGGPPGGDD